MHRLYRTDDKKLVFQSEHQKVINDIKFTYGRVGRGNTFAISIINGGKQEPKEAA